ncbi:MAG: NAD(P)-dependent oxidoreductase [Ruminococcaceae bacterium]|nr:NAD(P)-dependent oxidoreductase [Oscillospiraceae bacterium]
MKRAIISGATGAIGTALIRELIRNGVEVLILCRESSARKGRIPSDPQVSVKYCDLAGLATLENDTGKSYDAFFHFAWAGTAGPARNDTLLQSDNIRYALDAVAAAKRFGCEVFIGAGSQAEYGRVEGALKPHTPAFPETGYGIAKLCAGQLTRMAASQLGLRHIWVRVLSVYGPFDGENSMIVSTVRKMLAGEEPQFTKGEQLWDYLYSADAACAFRMIAEKGKDGAVYPLGGGKAEPLKNYILALRDAVDPKIELTFGGVPYAPNQVMHLCADIEAVTRDTGWVPTTPFAEGIAATVAWLKEGSSQKELA